MADYYTKLSFALTLTDAERDWLTVVFDGLEDAAVNGLADMTLDPAIRHVINELYTKHNQATGCLIEPTEEGLWIHADESANPEPLADLLQEACRQFAWKGAVTFEWANDCSKDRLDAFGGGAVVITATEQRWLSTGRWIDEQLEEMRKQESA